MTRFPIHILAVSLLLAGDLCAQSPDHLYVSEFSASNVSGHANPLGDYVDWIELRNPTDAPLDIAGYRLADSPDAADLWQIPAGQPERTTVPAGGYLLLYADERPDLGADHLDFKLSKEGEQIFLFAADGTTLLDSVTFGEQFRDLSYGRSPDDLAQWVYGPEITPGAANRPGYAGFAEPPEIDRESGFFAAGPVVTLTPRNDGETVRYTLDGSEPSATSPLYAGPVQIERTAVFKAKSFAPDALPSQTLTRTFFVGLDRSLPVLAVAIDPPDLSDPDTGLLLNDVPGREWERYAELEFFAAGESAFRIPAGLRIQGNTGPMDYEKKSFRAYFRDGYGEGELDYPLFPFDPVDQFDRLVLRAGYDDSLEPTDSRNGRATLLRDPLVAELWRRAGGLASQSRFCALYLNDRFTGIYDIRQNVDARLVEDHRDYENVDLVRARWDSVEVLAGGDEQWDEMLRFFAASDLADDDQLARAAQYIDLEEFATLQAMVHATEYVTWGYGVFIYRERTEEGVWRWIPWDADRAFLDIEWNSFTTPVNPLNRDIDSLITRKLLLNPSYRQFYINRFSDLFNTLLSPASLQGLVDSLAAEIAPEIADEVARWNNTVSQWNDNVAYLRDFVGRRPEIVRRQMQEFFQLQNSVRLTLDVDGGEGRIELNSLSLDRFPWTGQYYREVPVKLRAIPADGYTFVGWSAPDLPADSEIEITLDGSSELSALFTRIHQGGTELIAPRRVPPGQRLPYVVRIRDARGAIDPLEQTPVQVTFGDARPDTLIQIKRGAGTGLTRIDATGDFLLQVGNEAVPPARQSVSVAPLPTLTHSGTLPVGEVVWDASADHLITGDINVPEGCHLIVEKGTWIVIQKYVGFLVKGEVTITGTAEEPVVITSEKWDEPWGGMEFYGAPATFRYCMVLNGGGDLSKGFWHTLHQHIFYAANDSQFDFDNCFFLYCPGKVFGALDSEVTISNSVSAFVWHGGEMHRSTLFYRDSHLMNLPDDKHDYVEDIDTDGLHLNDIHLERPQFSTIDRCYFVTGKDDAIDHHNARLRVTDCWLEDFVHEGVAASGGDRIIVTNTLALNNGQGFEAGYTDVDRGVDIGPYLVIDHSVAVGNGVGLRIGDDYEYEYRDRVSVTNSVFYGNDDNVLNYINTLQGPLEGALEITHSMTNDPEYDGGTGNISGVPEFDPYYHLLPGSPGYGAGSDGTPMGKIGAATPVSLDSIVVDEIMHAPPDRMDTGDWIELHNYHHTARDLSGWILKDDDESHTFALPEGTVLPAGGFRVLAADTAAFRRFHPEVEPLSGDIPFGFGEADQVRLYDADGALVDSLAYGGPDWPDSTDGEGYSLELIAPRLDNALPENWARSIRFGGSPGAANRQPGPSAVSPEDEADLPTRFHLEQNYPNPFNAGTRIGFSLPEQTSDLHLEVFDLLGQKVATLIQPPQIAGLGQGTYYAHWDGRDSDGVPLASGVYLYRLRADGRVQTRRMLLLR